MNGRTKHTSADKLNSKSPTLKETTTGFTYKVRLVAVMPYSERLRCDQPRVRGPGGCPGVCLAFLAPPWARGTYLLHLGTSRCAGHPRELGDSGVQKARPMPLGDAGPPACIPAHPASDAAHPPHASRLRQTRCLRPIHTSCRDRAQMDF